MDGERSMTKSELIELIAAKQSHLPAKDVELAVKQVLEIMSDALAQGQRILVCSDGLTKELTAYGIRHFLVSHARAEDAVAALVAAALDNGGRDNVTAIVLDVLSIDDLADTVSTL